MSLSRNSYDRRLERTLSRIAKKKECTSNENNDEIIVNRNGTNHRFKRHVSDDPGKFYSLAPQVEYGDQTDSSRSVKSENIKFDFFDDYEESNQPTKTSSLIKGQEFTKGDFLQLDRNSHTIWRWMGLKFTNRYIESDRKCEPWAIITYTIITIEILIMILIISYHGFTMFGVSEQTVSKIILHQTNSYQSATYYELPNIWLGPSFSALIFEGARFTPCMRREASIEKAIEKRRILESNSGCCVRADFTGCVQTLQSQCSNRTSYWIRYPDRPGPVCGQDPKYCLDSKDPWPINITDWPTCYHNNYKSVRNSSDIHMKCNVRARPCCIGIYGKCSLVSQEYCDFMKGTYHPEATLCSQVSCMEDVCGSTLYPYQIYRILFSLFMNAGFIQLALMVWLQYLYMRPLEQLLGHFKVLILFLVSGAGGNLASAVFLPLLPDVGCSASLFGMISFLLYELIRTGKQEYHWLRGGAKLVCFLIILLLPGLFLPFVDFYSMIFGLIYGSLTLVLIHENSRCKPWKSLACLLLIILTSGFLFLLFFPPEIMADISTYANKLNCIPIPIINLNCSNLDIAYKEIKALN